MYYYRYRYCVLDRLQYVLECHTTLPGTVLRCSSTQYCTVYAGFLLSKSQPYSEHVERRCFSSVSARLQVWHS